MAKNRLERINEELRRELAALLPRLKDPRVGKTMLSVTRVETTPDLHYAKVYVSLLDPQYTKETLAGLRSSSGWLRRELGSAVRLRCIPELQWEADDSIVRGAHLLELISQIEEKENAESDTP